MMQIVDQLSNKEDWQTKVFNDDIVSKWRKEAKEIPDENWWLEATTGKGRLTQEDDRGPSSVTMPRGIVSDATFDFCIEELRAKAAYYKTSGVMPVHDVAACAVKSDRAVGPDLHEALCKGFEKLRAGQAENPDWHPNSNEMVQDLVHPSMYPLVYGRSRVHKEEVVGVADAVDKWASTGTAIDSIGDDDVPSRLWSPNFQWLPANVALQPDGSAKLTSYINNLHPQKYPELYTAVEKLIEASLPLWDQCLKEFEGDEKSETMTGQTKPRFEEPENPE
jgi:hypothetical protein